ncbi:MAG: hypothetical protein A4E38_01616 [Methanoregulaceae archaeon PtaB.Bin108]|nr:MAG: hypothetical protein A4E38_01616 [Methanoregulaceae archaeon PtaB.Bin108]
MTSSPLSIAITDTPYLVRTSSSRRFFPFTRESGATWRVSTSTCGIRIAISERIPPTERGCLNILYISSRIREFTLSIAIRGARYFLITREITSMDDSNSSTMTSSAPISRNWSISRRKRVLIRI